MQMYSKKIDDIMNIVPVRVRKTLQNALRDVENRVQEITLRTGRPLCVYINGEQLYLSPRATLTRDVGDQSTVILTSAEVNESFNALCEYSVYSHINEIKEGFITVKGGHRAAISGTAVVSNSEIINVRDISTISVRIAREIIGCGESIAEEIASSKGGLLICGAPVSGKTTVLRDLARLLSSKYSRRVSLIDTRGELASALRGTPQNDVGVCDVLDGYPREKGVEQAVRCLSPEFIICDEIGSSEDIRAILSGVNSGVKFVATLHAGSREELLSRRNAEEILKTGAFSRVIFLNGRENPGVVREKGSLEELLNV